MSQMNCQLADIHNPNLSQMEFKFSEEEKRVLDYWKEIDAFKTSQELNKDKPRFSFYDGPPFATGLPHYGHLLAGTIKDTVTRYAHQTGHSVERRFGWDCHGLPVEHEIDKTLGIKDREDVLAMGIDKYNEACRSIVMRYSKEWEATVTRMGRWIDFENDYKTMNLPFMESVWWVFKQLFEKDQVYRGFKVMPFSTACHTPLANFEVNDHYRDTIDPCVTVSFPVVGQENVYLLAWTTTPWTLPSNLALCVNPDLEYVQILDEETGQQWILLEKRLDAVYKDPKKAKFKIVKKMKGSELNGWKYVPLFPYYESKTSAFKVVCDAYVTDDSGTGIVHQAPGFGEDDYRVCLANQIISKEEVVVCPVDDSGRFTAEITDFAKQYVKDADKNIIKHLKTVNRLIKQSQINHSYPFCWRSDTPLIYKAIPSWFVRVENIVPDLLKNNQQTYWVPDFVKEKRFTNWLKNARDWCVSRNRYWGTPIPLWVSENFDEVVCVGSIEELKQLSGIEMSDLHRPGIDEVKIPSRHPGLPPLRRVEEVFDCWFESGSMPYAQRHYPFAFEDKSEFHQQFPADFIAEGLDQTRGWFYTLMVLSTHLFNQPPFKNLIVNGLVLAADGKKMSKKLKNYPDPSEILNKLGADALRLYLINSPVVRAEPLKFSEQGVLGVVKEVLVPWMNAYKFFVAQCLLCEKEQHWQFEYHQSQHLPDNVMDKWILASCQSLIAYVREEMAAYRLYTVVPRLLRLIEDLTNWYIRFNRKRLKGENGLEDTKVALTTLFEVLLTLCRTLACFTPFLTENMFQGLRQYMKQSQGQDLRSVHFLSFPEVRKELMDPVIERQVQSMQSVILMGRTIRDKVNIPLKTPLKELIVVNDQEEVLTDLQSLQNYIQEELNVLNLVFSADEQKYHVQYKATADWKVLGQKLRKEMPKVKNGLSKLSSQEIKKGMKEGELEIEGIRLTLQDLNIHRYYEPPANAGELNWTAQVDQNGLLVLMDTKLYPELKQQGLAREFMNRVQRLRKKLFLNPTQEIRVFYFLKTDHEQQLEQMFRSEQDWLMKQIKYLTKVEKEVIEKNDKYIGEEVVQIQGSDLLLALFHY